MIHDVYVVFFPQPAALTFNGVARLMPDGYVFRSLGKARKWCQQVRALNPGKKLKLEIIHAISNDSEEAR